MVVAASWRTSYFVRLIFALVSASLARRGREIDRGTLSAGAVPALVAGVAAR